MDERPESTRFVKSPNSNLATLHAIVDFATQTQAIYTEAKKQPHLEHIAEKARSSRLSSRKLPAVLVHGRHDNRQRLFFRPPTQQLETPLNDFGP